MVICWPTGVWCVVCMNGCAGCYSIIFPITTVKSVKARVAHDGCNRPKHVVHANAWCAHTKIVSAE
jgi:hypothetical protein